MRALRFGWVALAALGLVAGGCSSDPCDGQSGTCVSARVEGAVTGLDQLRVSIDQLSAQMLTPTTPAAFSLPVKLAILLPASVTSPATITIDGAAHGQGVATSGPQAVAFTAGGHASFTFTLVAGQVTGDGGTGDMKTSDGGASDMGFVPTPGHVSANPSTLNFPATPRGQQSAPQTITLYNLTGNTVTSVGTDGGSQGGDDFMPTSVSSSCTLVSSGVSIPAGAACDVHLVFAPQKSGTESVTMPLRFDNGDSVSVTFNGTGTPVWAAESVSAGASNTNLAGVWAMPGFAVVVGEFSGALLDQVAFTSTQAGQWVSAPTGLGSGYLGAVTGVDATHVWAGGPQAEFYSLQSTTSWTSQGLPDAGSTQAITSMWQASPTEAWAVNGDAVFEYSGSWRLAFHPLDFSGGTAFPTAVSGSGPGQIVVVGTNGYVALSGGSPLALNAFNSNSTASLRGVWQAPGGSTNVFAVGLAQTGGGPGSILHCSGAPFVCVSETAPINGDLHAISGRSVNGQLDIYAVGNLGNQVLHSTGNGTWTAVQVPSNGGMTGVYVVPNGEVYAVGSPSSGGAQITQINHLY